MEIVCGVTFAVVCEGVKMQNGKKWNVVKLENVFFFSFGFGTRAATEVALLQKIRSSPKN